MKKEVFGRELSKQEKNFITTAIIVTTLALFPIGAATTAGAVEQGGSGGNNDPDTSSCTSRVTVQGEDGQINTYELGTLGFAYLVLSNKAKGELGRIIDVENVNCPEESQPSYAPQQMIPLQSSSPDESANGSASGSSVDMSRFRPVNSAEFEQFVAQLPVGSVVEVVIDQGVWGDKVVRAIKRGTGNVLRILDKEGCDSSLMAELLAEQVLARTVKAIGSPFAVCQ